MVRYIQTYDSREKALSIMFHKEEKLPASTASFAALHVETQGLVLEVQFVFIFCCVQSVIEIRGDKNPERKTVEKN